MANMLPHSEPGEDLRDFQSAGFDVIDTPAWLFSNLNGGPSPGKQVGRFLNFAYVFVAAPLNSGGPIRFHLGRWYTWSYWYRRDTEHSGNVPAFEAGFDTNDLNGVAGGRLAVGGFASTATEWRRASVSWQANSDGYAQPYAFQYNGTGPIDYHYVHGFQFEESPVPTAYAPQARRAFLGAPPASRRR